MDAVVDAGVSLYHQQAAVEPGMGVRPLSLYKADEQASPPCQLPISYATNVSGQKMTKGLRRAYRVPKRCVAILAHPQWCPNET